MRAGRPPSRGLAALVSALILCAPAARAQPQAPKLDAQPVPTAAADSEPARPLPPALAICVDRAARRCWSGERPDDCHATGGELFATVPIGQGDPGGLLRSCWDEVGRKP